jgi:acetyl esterase
MALDEATREFLARMAEQGGTPMHEMQPAEARAMGGALTELSGPGPEVASVTERELTTSDGHSFEIRVLAPAGEPRAVVVYYHGGGWVLGDIDQFDNLGRQLANRTGSAVVLVNYRKAPEHPYPAAVEDSWQALNWAADHVEAIAGRRVPLIVAGDSAGGNLSAVMAQRARDRSGPAIDLQVLVYPVTDADLDTASYLAPDNQLLLSREGMVWFWDHYVPVDRRREPDASPLRAQDLAGLPPAVVLTAEHDPLRDEGEAYAAALAAAGVPVRSRRFPGQMHGFFSMVNILPGSAAGIDHVVAEIDRHLAAKPVTT